MAEMKRLYEAIEEAKSLSRTQPLDAEWLESMIGTVQQIARYDNGVQLLLKELFPPER